MGWLCFLSVLLAFALPQAFAQAPGEVWGLNGKVYHFDYIYGFKVEDGSGYVNVFYDGQPRWISGVAYVVLATPEAGSRPTARTSPGTGAETAVSVLQKTEPSLPALTRARPDGVQESAVVRRAIDGDTIELQDGRKVRLIGVDTPETVDPRKPVQYFGKEASAFTALTVEGKNVSLTYDQDREDRYGRTLAYVWLAGGVCLNELIIRQGYGHAYTQYPFREDYMEIFREAEREARENGRGLWNPAGGGGTPKDAQSVEIS